jgi:TetR/AcrR family acrAB operon transcriptional repressor
VARRTKVQAEETRQQIIEAARSVFYRQGVNGSSLEMVALEAGLTRGAIYWHFKDKADIFLAVRQSVLLPILAEIESIFVNEHYADPLDCIDAALRRFFQILQERPCVRMVLETITCRCEHVAEFADIQSGFEWSPTDLLTRLESVYGAAAELGTLRPDLPPKAIARDTWAFFHGLVNRFLLCEANGKFRSQVFEMIAFHMALRRCGRRGDSSPVMGIGYAGG